MEGLASTPGAIKLGLRQNERGIETSEAANHGQPGVGSRGKEVEPMNF